MTAVVLPTPTPSHRWDVRMMRLARRVALWSKDPSTRCGAVVMRPDHTVAGVGYNGFPRALRDEASDYNDRSRKYPRIIHAEWNALRSARDTSLAGCTVYSWPMPSCDECTASMLQKDIARIVQITPTDVQAERWKSAFASSEAMWRARRVPITWMTDEELDTGADVPMAFPEWTEALAFWEQPQGTAAVVRGGGSEWDIRFLSLAAEVGAWGRDAVAPGGCVVVRPDKTIASLGFSGVPRHAPNGRPVPAAMNALLFARDHDLTTATAYCWPAALDVRAIAHLIQAGVRSIVTPGPMGCDSNGSTDGEARTLFHQVGGFVRSLPTA